MRLILLVAFDEEMSCAVRYDQSVSEYKDGKSRTAERIAEALTGIGLGFGHRVGQPGSLGGQRVNNW